MEIRDELSWEAEFPSMDSIVYLSGVVSDKLLAACDDREDLGLLVQPRSAVERGDNLQRVWGYAADNGCFSQGDKFNVDRWMRWLETLPLANCLFAVLPDVVGDPVKTFDRSMDVLAEVKEMGFPVAFVAQDGVEHLPDKIPWEDLDCLFIGGSTEWKLSEAVIQLGRKARDLGKWTHVGRVNSLKRLRWAAAAGFDSADGTYLGFGPDVNLPKLLGWCDRVSEEEYPENQEWRASSM